MEPIKRLFYNFRDILRTIAVRTYPFIEKDASGEKVYLDKAYMRRYEICQAEFGSMPNMRCTRIFVWSQFLHLWGAVLFWVVAIGINMLVTMPWNLILPIFVIIYFGVQELYLDRVRYEQRFLSGLIDWAVWGVPLVLYLFFVLL